MGTPMKLREKNKKKKMKKNKQQQQQLLQKCLQHQLQQQRISKRKRKRSEKGKLHDEYMEHEHEGENLTSLQTISTSGIAAADTALSTPHPISVGTPEKDDDPHCSHEHEFQLVANETVDTGNISSGNINTDNRCVDECCKTCVTISDAEESEEEDLIDPSNDPNTTPTRNQFPPSVVQVNEDIVKEIIFEYESPDGHQKNTLCSPDMGEKMGTKGKWRSQMLNGYPTRKVREKTLDLVSYNMSLSLIITSRQLIKACTLLRSMVIRNTLVKPQRICSTKQK